MKDGKEEKNFGVPADVEADSREREICVQSFCPKLSQ